MSLERTVHLVQVAFPQVYLACHTRHQRKRTTAHRVSSRDASILAHLAADAPVAPADLAAHLSIAKSTLSEAIKRLTALGYVAHAKRTARDGARGGVGLTLTAQGAAVIRDTSVLETERLRAALETLTVAERRAVGRGMDLLADACRRAALA